MKLGERMKNYEVTSKIRLMKRIPVIMRLDGKTFHTYTKGMAKPWDNNMFNAMANTTKFLCENIPQVEIGYFQSDEISLLLVDYKSIESQPWFDYQIQKMVSITAGMAALSFNTYIHDLEIKKDKFALFDARVFNCPKEEVNNYFLWRQQDATRNSIQGLAQSLFSHKEMQGINNNDLQNKMLVEKNVNWNNCLTWQKRGACLIKEKIDRNGVLRTQWKIDYEIPIFVEDRNYIEKYVYSLENQIIPTKKLDESL